MTVQVEESVSRLKSQLWDRTHKSETERKTLESRLQKIAADTAAKHEQVARKLQKMQGEVAAFKQAARDPEKAEVQLYRYLNLTKKQRRADERALLECQRRIEAIENEIKKNESMEKQRADNYARADAGNAAEIAQWSQLLQLEMDPKPEGLHIKFVDKQRQYFLTQIDGVYRLYQVSADGARRELSANFDGCLPRLLLRLRGL